MANSRTIVLIILALSILSACSSQQSATSPTTEATTTTTTPNNGTATTPPANEYIPDATDINPNPRTLYVQPGQSIQDVIDSAASDDKIILMPGVHEHDVRKFDSVLYIDKAIDLEIMNGAELKAVVNNVPITGPFVITNHSPVPAQSTDFIVQSDATPRQSVSYTIKVKPGGISWSVSSSSDPATWWGESIPIEPGTPIKLNNGISITPTNKLSVGAIYFIVYEASPYFVIRVGNGLQAKYISRVKIHCEGTINANIFNNKGTQIGHAIYLSSGILLNGRVRNVAIDGIVLLNCQRSIQVYSEHTGNYLSNGETVGGISFDAENISIDRVKVDNSNDGFLIGHPEHRGKTRNVSITNNSINVSAVGIEPNFRLDGFAVSSNVISSKYSNVGISLWRGPSNGTVIDNVFRGSATGEKQCVLVSTPGNWPESSNIFLNNNTVIP